MEEQILRKPKWLAIKLPTGKTFLKVKKIVAENQLHTICKSGNCPNMGECWGNGTATFMIIGDICTRNCTFCNVNAGKPVQPDMEEPKRIANAVKIMNLKHCVITSVTRDDLMDKGAFIWAETVKEVKNKNKEITLEILIPDMNDDFDALKLICNTKPEIISHNMETVKELYSTIRPQADYDRSLRQIQKTKELGIRSKSGFMIGLGESQEQVFRLIDDLAKYKADVITIGQYLRPSKKHYPVKEYVSPKIFDKYEKYAYSVGIDYVEAAPLVRSSYHSDKHM